MKKIIKKIAMALVAVVVVTVALSPVIFEKATPTQVSVVKKIKQYQVAGDTRYLIIFQNKKTIQTGDYLSGLLVVGDTVEYKDIPLFYGRIIKVYGFE